MAWAVEVYREEVDGQWSQTVEDEALALITDPSVKVDAARLVGWLKAVASGKVSPEHEADIISNGCALKYRCDGSAVIIFTLFSQRLVVLRFGRSASAYPMTADLSLAAQRLRLWAP